MTLVLPSNAGGAVTQEVGYFEARPDALASWLVGGLEEGWNVRLGGWKSLSDVVDTLAPARCLTRYAVSPVKAWTVILNNAANGTDVGLLPSQAARECECRTVRAVCVEDDEPGFPARILGVYGPDGRGPLKSVRSIAVANDGGEWAFETSGEPLPFEQPDYYARRRKTDRFTGELLREYLRRLGVPAESEPDWDKGLLVADGAG